MKKGKLYVVATPIGNLEDVTFRALKILKKVPFVLAEDTRESKKLLDRYKINTQLISYRDQNHDRIINKIFEKLDMGLDLALVSDNGTPLISDPGYRLVKELREKNYEVISIPGPSALTSSLSISGLPTDRFIFLGFLPKSDSKRENILNTYLGLENTVVIYESPNRIFKLLKLIARINSEVTVCAVRDMTKKREKSYYGNVNLVLQNLTKDGIEEKPHGEWVIVLSKKL
jgi:16S rRNA (cytidine1402-2'-O)-methyltransferase